MEFSEFEFSLPKGLVDSDGGVHRYGMMRLATGKDEIVIHKDRVVREDPGYKILVVLSNVITRLGSVSLVTPKLLEELFLIDLIYLQEFFNRINQEDGGVLSMGEL